MWQSNITLCAAIVGATLGCLAAKCASCEYSLERMGGNAHHPQFLAPVPVEMSSLCIVNGTDGANPPGQIRHVDLQCQLFPNVMDLASTVNESSCIDVYEVVLGIEVVVLKIRNPYRSSFDLATGDSYTSDVGFHTAENVGFIPASHGHCLAAKT